MASVTAPTAPAASQPQTEFVKAMSLTDATMLVAGSMIGSGIFIVSAISYPVLPALSIALAGGVMILILSSPTSRTEAVCGQALVPIGIPVHYPWRKVDGARPLRRLSNVPGEIH